MKVDVILGLQWGDEGKGKIVDVFTPHYDVIARFQGGPNAGHTIEFGGKKYVLHTIPSGIFHARTQNVIGNGVIIDPLILFREIDKLQEAGIDARQNLLVSRRAHLILPSHRLLDAALESTKGEAKIGSTLKGIGPCYTDKYGRNGLRVGDLGEEGFKAHYTRLREEHLAMVHHFGFDVSLQRFDSMDFDTYESRWFEAVERMKGLTIIDSETYINNALDENRSVLAEGAQGTLLDVDFGSYPFVTSSNTISAGVCAGLGISPRRIGKIYGVFKAYCTRVGSGPFPTELKDGDGDQMRREGNEFGSTTGRPRRCGWLDLPALKYAIMLNGVDSLIMMKADVLNSFSTLKVATGYRMDGAVVEGFPYDLSDARLTPEYSELKGWSCSLEGVESMHGLPVPLADYIRYIEDATGMPIEMLSVGPDRTQTLKR